MPSSRDSERRKARDKLIRTQDDAIAEHLEQARRSGELQSAQSFGKPFADSDGYRETPTEFRLPFKILKNAGIAPPEIDLFHKRAALRRELETCSSEEERQALQQRLSEVEQFIALRLEGMRASGKL